MFTFNILLAVLLSVALLLSEKKLQVEAADACYSNLGCSSSNYYCCKKRSWQDSICRYGGCVGQPCALNSDCGGSNECCSSNVCTKSCQCYSDLGCGLNDYCCKQTYSWQSKICRYGGCVGKYCSSTSDCGGSNECCSSNVCTKSCQCSFDSDCSDYNNYCCKQTYTWQSKICRSGGCVGKYCSSSSDCGGSNECCSSNVCTKSCQCSFDSDCSGYNDSCCKQTYSWQSKICHSGGCVGKYCSSTSDCGGTDECCLKNVCTKSCQCSSDSDCSDYSDYCCKHTYYWESGKICHSGGCVGKYCSSNSDCGGTDECCSGNVCTKSCQCYSNSDCSDYDDYCCKQMYSWQSKICRYGGCVGKYCSSDGDCVGQDECCSSSNYCTKSDCQNVVPSWLIAVIVVSAVVGLAIVVGCSYGLVRASRGRARRGVVVRQQQPGTTVFSLQNTQAAQSNPEQLQIPPPPPSVYLNQGQDLAASQPVSQGPPPAYTTKY